jgi:hypothetical protein
MKVIPTGEVRVVSKPKPTGTPTEQIARFNPSLIWGPHCLATDIAVGGWDYSEYFLEQDEATQSRMLTVRLEAESAVHRVVSEANAKMAEVVKARK